MSINVCDDCYEKHIEEDLQIYESTFLKTTKTLSSNCVICDRVCQPCRCFITRSLNCNVLSIDEVNRYIREDKIFRTIKLENNNVTFEKMSHLFYPIGWTSNMVDVVNEPKGKRVSINLWEEEFDIDDRPTDLERQMFRYVRIRIRYKQLFVKTFCTQIIHDYVATPTYGRYGRYDKDKDKSPKTYFEIMKREKLIDYNKHLEI